MFYNFHGFVAVGEAYLGEGNPEWHNDPIVVQVVSALPVPREIALMADYGRLPDGAKTPIWLKCLRRRGCAHPRKGANRSKPPGPLQLK